MRLWNLSQRRVAKAQTIRRTRTMSQEPFTARTHSVCVKKVWLAHCHRVEKSQSGLELMKHFFCSTELSMNLSCS